MSMIPNPTTLDDKLKLMAKVARSMTRYPDQVQFKVAVTRNRADIDIVAHPNDARRLVGANGTVIASMVQLTKMLFRNEEQYVSYGRVESNGSPAESRVPFKPKKFWPRDDIVALADELTKAIFPNHNSTVETLDTSDVRTALNIYVVGIDSYSESQYTKAMARVFSAIGFVHGRILQVNVNAQEVINKTL